MGRIGGVWEENAVLSEQRGIDESSCLIKKLAKNASKIIFYSFAFDETKQACLTSKNTACLLCKTKMPKHNVNI